MPAPYNKDTFKSTWEQGYMPQASEYDDLFDSLLWINDHRGQPNGVAPLGTTGKMPLLYLDPTGGTEGQAIVLSGGTFTLGDVLSNISVVQGETSKELEKLTDKYIAYLQDDADTKTFHPYIPVKTQDYLNKAKVFSIAENAFRTNYISAETGNRIYDMPPFADMPDEGWMWIINTGNASSYGTTLRINGTDRFNGIHVEELNGNDSPAFLLTSGRGYKFAKNASTNKWDVVDRVDLKPSTQAPETELGLVNNGNVVELDMTRNTSLFRINTSEDYELKITKKVEGKIFTIHLQGSGSLTNITGATGIVISQKNFSGTHNADGDAINGISDITQTSNDLLILHMQGTKVFFGIENQTSV